MVIVPVKIQEAIGVPAIKRGQRLNINGYLRSIPFTDFNSKQRRAICIFAREIEIYPNDYDLPTDICIVMLTAHIESPIWQRNNQSIFNLRTHIAIR